MARGRRGTRIARGFVLLLLVAGIPLLLAPWWWGMPGEGSHDVAIPAGTTLAGAAYRLQQADVVASANQFRLLARLFGAPPGRDAVSWGSS